MVIQITDRDKKILNQAKFDTMLRLPSMTDDEYYHNIKYLVEYIGGHWRERFKGYNFDEPGNIVLSKLKQLMDIGYIEITTDKAFQIKNNFYPTPDWLAAKMVEIADIKRGERVLEPSAGRGALLKYMSHKTYAYYAVEYNRDNVQCLRHLGYRVNAGSFENYYKNKINSHGEKFNKIVMNPPFFNEMDLRHTIMAYNLLKPGGKLISLVAENSLYYQRPVTTNFNAIMSVLSARIIDIPHGSFKQSGTNVDVSMIIINKHPNYDTFNIDNIEAIVYGGIA